MIKIAHEAPIGIMPDVREYTDYDYALVHLFETHPEYYKFFELSIKLGRTVILDNSIFELGEAFDSKKYAYWIEKLKPTEYIIPDVLENYIGTVDSARDWMRDYGHLPGKKIGVVHGGDFNEMLYCYKRLVDLGVDKIAFTFRGSFYENEGLGEIIPSNNNIRLMSWALGRIRVLEKFVEAGVIQKGIPHHLLGCSLPQEFLHYAQDRFDWIESLDTSNPIVLGLDYQRYDEQGGVSYKAKSLLFERIDEEVVGLQKEIIFENITSFRNLLKRNK